MLQYFILSKKTAHSLATYFNQYLFLHPNVLLKNINDQKYTKGLQSYLKVNDTYESTSNDFIKHLQLFYDNNRVLLPIF